MDGITMGLDRLVPARIELGVESDWRQRAHFASYAAAMA
jgi:hypothetical protein